MQQGARQRVLAAMLGLPYAFASHFAPAALHDALAIYRANFQPSAQLAAPYVMLGVNAIAAPTEAEARLLATSMKQAFLNLRRGRPGLLPPPDENFDATLAEGERAMLDQVLACSAIGTPAEVAAALATFAGETGADELMLAANVFDPDLRIRSYRMIAEERRSMAA